MKTVKRRLTSIFALVFLKLAAIASLLIGVHSFAFAGSPDLLPCYRVDAWKTGQSLPHNTIEAILQTRDGYLWLATHGGLARFDGVKFSVFNRRNTSEMVSDECHALAEDTDGNLWIGTYRGLLRYRDGSFKHYTTEDGLLDDDVRRLVPSRNGGVWIGGEKGLNYFQAEQFIRYELPAFAAMAEDAAGSLWIASDRLQRLDPQIGLFVPVPIPGQSLGTSHVGGLYFDRNGAFWVLKGNQLFQFQDGRWIRHSRDQPVGTKPGLLMLDRSGFLWFANSELKLVRFRDGVFTPFGTKEGLSDDRVLSVHEDREGNIWIGTVSGGLNRLQPLPIQTYTKADGLAHDVVWTVCERRDGSIWLGTHIGLSCFKEGRFTSYTSSEESGEGIIRSLAEDRHGRLWIGAAGKLNYLDGEHIAPALWPETLRQHTIRVLLAGRDDSLWVGTRLGLFRLWQDRLTSYSTTNGLSDDDVRTLLEDRSGALWIGTASGGLNRFHEGRITALTQKDGLSTNLIYTLHQDAADALWLGTANGINRFKDGRFAAITTRHGLVENVIYQILEDESREFWMSGEHGIYRVPRQELDDVADGRANALHCVTYDESDGMLSAETTGNRSQPAGCKTRDGRLWFPTTKGVVVLDPKTMPKSEAPPVVIEQVLADNEIIFRDGVAADVKRLTSKIRDPKAATQRDHPDRSGTSAATNGGFQSQIVNRKSQIDLPPGRARVLEIQYTATSLTAPQKNRFKYRLEGLDPDWLDVGTRRVAYYTNLRPGDYRFRVMACNSHGVWNEAGASFAFSLAPHFYETTFFYLGSALAVCAIGYGLHRRRLAFHRRIDFLERHHALDQERARIARDLHDDIGSRLTQLSILTELADREAHASNEQPGVVRPKLTELANEMARSLDQIVWLARPGQDTLDHLVSYIGDVAQEYLKETSVQLNLDLPDHPPARPVPLATRKNLLLIINESLNNVLKHSQATTVDLRLTLMAEGLRLEVADNGRGIEKPKSDIRHPKSSTGNGLANMRERAASIGGKFQMESGPVGTRITVDMPLPK